ncbi:MAG: NAD(P)H-dependent glycerol-3-phosphate dehydrogenase [Zymomonas mobilis subsp. pomaceae]|uniref:Glycerol-3-phosphate dehydrogenase [NAD(P)+] n=1 Tax=Zymomonas mobilis subsp. pomaceae (strain ATCC 29192 / DSM 22645 / JCM 10191 / CCUG 17912 / NBRC 13757 / NCIMB 11200 / NRRL B-4491 / Barker I) TaxID=579138 RepID=F8EU90_ZYMMT|nr:NAD(P)H-dependent glycerol-3-phosphate dehydrogenase [Zymomonas mobilis]AEI38111.1 Glycerol-3-phosphate dehydrogenase (NAD(P)(+)) [Zymomonas mobilis subsp. pomaceae ATCC 29192]MDX5949477.1 NAD(P)H-dependent glycerol-3-phosphate dehydrogenase [Zymomonas mobilis subsp. pomaceae]GEB89220.1 glycerol-3-phosphate dehydrogenase [NAD(P)+] [Zymomonas mobilis subsp. pomaceae]
MSSEKKREEAKIFPHIGILGTGAWGTALAMVASHNGPATLWGRRHNVVCAINERHINPDYLPDISLPKSLHATDKLEDLKNVSAFLVAIPAQKMRSVLNLLPDDDRPLILCAKGIEAHSGLLMSQLAAEIFPNRPIGLLSGPTFASEVARNLPTAVTLAAKEASIRYGLMERLAIPTFRPYASCDVIGADVGGAIKNVLAIACGVVAGAELGHNARAAIISRGFAEMTRLGIALGAKQETLTGLSGLGDLVLTCSSDLSRNFTFGKKLGQGYSFEEQQKIKAVTTEGVFTAPVLERLAARLKVEMPLISAICALIRGESLKSVVDAVLNRPLQDEYYAIA